MNGRVSSQRLPVKNPSLDAVQAEAIFAAQPGAMTRQGTSDASDGAYDLGKLNRHWYRRCLDTLGRTLNAGGASPSVEQLQELCDQLVTSFLTAVTGQSPDSDRSQFPADRAYYIPFAGDRAGKFNFAKPYFQLLSAPAGYPEQSLWSFLPWPKTAAENGHADLRIEIDGPATSLDVNQATISFAELLKSQAGDVVGSTDPESQGQSALRLRKSLLLRGESETTLSFAKSDDFAGGRDALRKDINSALLGIFDVYKAFPGNAAIELLLLNHFQILRWLWQLVASTSAKGTDSALDGVTTSPREDIDGELFDVLLQAYFLGVDRRDRDSLNVLRSWVLDRETVLPLKLLKREEDTPFQRAVRQREAPPHGSQDVRKRKGSEIRSNDPEFANHYPVELEKLHPHFASFRDFFRPEIEERLESDLAASSPDDPRRAGAAKRSFVWVCADFEKLDNSLPKGFDPRVSKGMSLKDAEEWLAIIGKPYQRFFQELEAQSLKRPDHKDAISSYWRTRGDAARFARVFGSFHRPDGLPALPLNILEFEDSPRPQNIFLRVKICDSLNEPMIDGLFVFTTDHDEVVMKGKDPALRREDIEDLLAFGKVFFFIVRDHLHGLDRARESADIGRLNQHLYDRRLDKLDTRMNQRLATEEFRRDGVSSPENWAKFTYEILNNFAYSLIEKPEDVRNETFPYDRLLLIPLPEEQSRDEDHDPQYDLPFYLFQALYVECRDQKIRKGMYSLLKPFQSPVEDFDEKTEDGKRFHARSFQEVSDAGGRKRRLEEFLQKHYVSAHDPSGSEGDGTLLASDEPASYVVKTVSRDGKWDYGREWAQWAYSRFWNDTKEDAELWLGFLCDLTESYRMLLESGSATDQDRMWFLCRYGLVRAALQFVREGSEDETFHNLQRGYDRELRLRFGGNAELDLLKLISGEGIDPVEVLERRKMMPDGPGQIGFVDYLLKTEDRWVREFLKTLTNLVSGKEESQERRTPPQPVRTEEEDQGRETYYQDLLTRPVEDAASSAEVSKHRLAAEQIGKRIPPYEAIAAGQDTIATFLGILNLTVGTTDLDRRRLRCVIVMMRDYDDTKTGRVQSEAEARKKLEVDRGDLTLYTRMFFQNVHRFLTTARERQQVRILSTDITQIARSWYSSGIDFIVASLQDRLHELVEGSDAQKLGRLRPELVDCAFASILNVLIRKEKRRDGVGDIELESFPFDRILHIPLLFGPTAAARWCYARVTFANSDSGSSPVEPYDQIRKRGRHALLKGGKKIIAAHSPVYLGPGEFFEMSDAAHEAVRSLTEHLAEQPPLLDRFVRRLNEAHALQTLALGGTIYHLLKQRESGPADLDRRGWMPGAERVTRELRGVVERSVRSIERDGESVTVLTEAHMDRPISLEAAQNRAKGEPSADALFKLFKNVNSIPIFHELFAAIEGPDYRYGLAAEGSKVFYVYYSIPAPDGFIERDELDSRYRGLFCLIVDDAQTDDKKQADDDGLSDAEAADLDDIRTFIHNAMCNLGHVLGQQALQHRILRPGIAQDVMGMMHRLKNELNGPVSTLSRMKRALAAPAQIPERTRELTSEIASAEDTIVGIHDLFHNMKRLSEFEHGNIPLQTFSSDWLAWAFLLKLCQACVKTIAEQRGSGSENAATREINKISEDAKARLVAAASLRDTPGGAPRAKELTDAVESVQKALFTLARIFGGEYASPAGTKVDFTFTFEAFTIDKPLEFRGSYLLDEALDTLIDNAFQALLSYLETQIQEQQPAIVGRMRFVCREHDETDDEILLELRNSSNELAPKLLAELNADPPRTVSAAIHAEVSGKKSGSGFGHYFARRIVSEYCGGRQARRQLDIRLQYDRGVARTQLRLLKAQKGGYHTIESQDLIHALASEYKDAAVLAKEEIAADARIRYCVPGDMQLRGLLRTLRDVLSEDAELSFDDLLNLFRTGLCAELIWQVDALRDRLAAKIEEAASFHPELGRRAAQLRDISECRKGSLHDLNRVLEEWRAEERDTLQTVLSFMREGPENKPADGIVIEQLERVLKGDGLNPEILIPDRQRSGFAKKFRRFSPYFKTIALTDGLGALINSVDKFDTDADGFPMPSKRILAERFCRPRFAFELSSTNSGMTLDIWAYVLPDAGGPAPDFHGMVLRDLNANDLCTTYRRNMLGRTVAQYQDEFVSDERRIGSLRLFCNDAASPDSTAIPVWKAQVVLLAAARESESTAGVES
jgi:hypothetical protein